MTAEKIDFSTLLLGHTSVASNQTQSSTTATEIAALANAVTIPDGASKVKVALTGRGIFNTTGNIAVVEIWDGAVGGTLVAMTAPSGSSAGALSVVGYQSVTAGVSKTYRVSTRQSGGGVTTLSASPSIDFTVEVVA